MATTEMLVTPRHIQDFSNASSLEPHWGYVDRVLPCTNDAGSCEYLDAVYGGHDLSLKFAGIMWCVIAGIFLIWAIARKVWPSPRVGGIVVAGNEKPGAAGGVSRLKNTVAAYTRSYLLPDAARPIFGRTTRLQVLVLAVLAGYLLVFSFVGMVYQIWITPVKTNPALHNTRSTLGPWSDRIGILAYALTPLSIMLGSRESILSLVTGLPYQSFNFLHRWLGYIIVIQASLHTAAWTIIEVRLYQPQPTTAIAWITQTYMIWGVVAMILLLLLFVLSTPWAVRLTGYEAFRKGHYVLAMVYIGACWGHWEQLKCFMVPSLILWLLDRAVRLIKTALIQYQHLPGGGMGFTAAHGTVAHFSDFEHGDVIRIDFSRNQDAWKVGQHFYICFTERSIWQSHPFTPLNLPEVKDGLVKHSYIIRAKKGETKKVADLALVKLATDVQATTSMILSGPYGDSIMDALTPDANVLCVAGGTGITYVLPVLLSLIREPASADRKIDLVWAIRKKDDIRWVEQELDLIRQASQTHGVTIRIFATRDGVEGADASTSDMGVKELGHSASSSSSATSSKEPRPIQTSASWGVQRMRGGTGQDSHPDLQKIVNEFVDNTVRGPTRVYASGPGGMVSDLRAIVAGCNSGTKVWKGNERFDVGLTCDDRLEW